MLSKKLESFERSYSILNERFFENALSNVVISISPTPGSYGHFTPWESWEAADGKKMCEINLGAETINRPIEESIATLVHEMVHQYCYEHEVKDCSRGNTYHNKRFKAEAEKRGLVIEYSPRIGWSKTTPGEPIKQMVRDGVFDECEKELHRVASFLTVPGTKKTSSTRKYVCPTCGCSVRATKEVNVTCADCDERMELAS